MKKSGTILSTLVIIGFLGIYILEYFQSYYFVIPIEYINAYQIPCTSIEVDGNRYEVEIDFGSKTALSLQKNVLDKIKKDPCGTSQRIDFRGNKHETPSYLISNVKVGTFNQKTIKAREESSIFANEDSIIIKATRKHNDGRLGRDFFSGKNIFMDFNHQILIACSHLKDIEKEGYMTKSFQPIPFKCTGDGVILEIETDFGFRKFVLDTGTTATTTRKGNISCIDPKNGLPFIESTKFSMNGNDFGPQKIYCLDISPELNEIDGFLGMEFLKDHIVYLDFKKEIAYIGKNLNQESVNR